MVQDHPEQAGGEGDHNQSQQQPTLCTQFLPITKSMDDAQQQKQNRCHFMNMDTGKGYHDGHDEADQQCDVKYFLHALTSSLVAGIVFTPKIK